MLGETGSEGVYTAEELVDDALKAGHQVTVRLITDWAELGLLDRPRRRPLGRGRGSQKAVWPESQRGLFLTLLHHRATVRRVAGLTNIPVWIWLVWGEDWVPRRQARRALGTWCGRHHGNIGLTQAEAGRMARRFLETVVQPQTRPKDRAELRRLIERSLATMTFDEVAFHDIVKRVFDPNDEGRVIGPALAPLGTEVVVRGVEARFAAFQRLEQVTNQQYDDARFVYLTMNAMYAPDWAALSKDPATGHMHPEPTLENQINGACFHLLTILGMNMLDPEGIETIAKIGIEKGIVEVA